jgi:anti-anti-sigma factor
MNNDDTQGQIYYAIIDHQAFLKLTGVLRYPLSQRLNLTVEKIFADAEIHSVVVDLQAAQYIDSTCMGLLARVATQCLERGSERPILVSVHPEVNRVLRSMGFDRVFVLVENPDSPTSGLADAASLAGLTSRPDPNIVLAAHRALCEINEENRPLFQNVIDQLESGTRRASAP